MTHTYVLTDGDNIYKVQDFDNAQLEDAQKDAEKATDGNLYWILQSNFENPSFGENGRPIQKATGAE